MNRDDGSAQFFWNDQQNLDTRELTITSCRPELPLLQRCQDKLRLRELRWKYDFQSLEMTGLVHKSVNHDCLRF